MTSVDTATFEQLREEPPEQPDRIAAINLMYGEFVPPSFTFELELDFDVDPDQVPLAVYVEDVEGRSTLRDARTIAWSAEAPMPEGTYVLHYSSLVDPESGEPSDERSIPFAVYDSAADPPEDVILVHFCRLAREDEHLARLPLGAEPSGDYVELFKTVGREDGQPGELAFDSSGYPIDFDALLQEYEDMWRDRYGKLHPALFEQLADAADDEPVDVAAWLDIDEPILDHVKEVGRDPDGGPLAEEAELIATTAAATAEVAADLGDRFPGVPFEAAPRAPVVFATMPAGHVREVAEHPGVAMVFPVLTEVELYLKDSLAVSGWFDVSGATCLGKHIKVAVFEDRPDTVALLDIEGTRSPGGRPSWHARLVTAIIKNTEAGKPKGYAPYAKVYTANPMSYAALWWAFGSIGCTVLNQSWGFTGERGMPYPSLSDVVIDDAVMKWPYPTVSRAAGNDGPPGLVGPKSYNTMVVGAHNDTCTSVPSWSSFRNPAAPRGDRELPELCANGTGVAAARASSSGTSFAAPAVAGAAAAIQGEKPKLKVWPEGCRAILLASCTRKPTGSTWRDQLAAGIDQRDGAGALSVDRAIDVTVAGEWLRSAGTRFKGWTVGTLRPGDFGTRGLTTWWYSVLAAPRARVRVALCWSRRTDPANLLRRKRELDLDLWLFDNRDRPVAHSASFDNNYEVIDFENGRDAISYRIHIRHVHGALPPTWFGLAWIAATR